MRTKMVFHLLTVALTTHGVSGATVPNAMKGYDAKQHDWAIFDYAKAIKMNPELALAYVARGLNYCGKGYHDRAISDFTKATEILPRYADAYYYRGNAYFEKGQYDRAISDYTRVIEINPRYADAYYNSGAAYHEKGQYDRAISDYTKFIEINPRDAMAYNNRGVAHHDKGQYDRAISDYTKAIEINPRAVKAYNGKAWLLATCPIARYRDGAKAVELAQKAIELYPIPTFLGTLAAAYAELGKFEDAITNQEKAIAQLKKEGKTENQIGEFIEHLKNYIAHKPWRETPKTYETICFLLQTIKVNDTRHPHIPALRRHSLNTRPANV